MKFILGAIVWLLILIIAVIPLGILSLVKLLLIAIYCRSTGTNRGTERDIYKIVPLAKGDVIVSTNSSWKSSIVNVGFVLKVEGNVTVDQFQQHFAKCFGINHNTGSSENENRYEKLFSFLLTRHGFVFRGCLDKLNLEEQIKERKLKKNEGEAESLENCLVRWILEKYSENRPCWEIAVIPVSSKCTAIAFKVHHGLCDGYSLLHIIDTLTGTKSPYLVKPFIDGFWSQLKQILESPLNLSRIGGNPPESNPLRVILPPPAERKYEWMYSFTEFPLEHLKTLRRKNGGVHMAAIIWTIVSGAIRKFLLEEQGQKLEEIPEFVKVGNTLPWPEHPAMIEGTQNENKICNHWVAGILQVPLREPDPFIRLNQIEADYCSYLSIGLDKFANRVLYPVLWTIPGTALEPSLTSKDIGITAGLTSLIGGDSYSILGHSVTNIHPLMCIHDNSPFLPLSCFTFSHSGKMELTMSANPQGIALKDQSCLDKLCHKFCHDELQNFLTLTENKASE